MKSIQIPGALWVALITGLIPVVQSVITQFYPEASYAWSAAVVTVLGALLKGIQVAASKQQPILPASTPSPAASPQTHVDGDNYTYDYATLQQPGKLARWLLG